MALDRFPAPWRVTREEKAYCVVDGNGLILSRSAFSAGEPGPTDLSEDEARQLAEAFAALPELLRRLHVSNLARPAPKGSQAD